MRRLAIFVIGLAVALAVAWAIARATFDWNRVRPWVEQAASEGLDRAVTIGGEIEPKFSLSPTLSAQDVRVSQSSEKSGPLLGEFKHFEVRFRLLPLIFKQSFEMLGVSASDGRVVIADDPAGGKESGAADRFAWFSSLPLALDIANLDVEFGEKHKKSGALHIERASAGRCGDPLEIEARRHGVTLSFAGKLVCPGKARVGLSGFEAKIGRSAVAGSLELDLSGKRPRLSGGITSSDIDVDELVRPVQADGTGDRSWLDTALPFAQLASLDADLKLARTKVRLPWKDFGAVDNLSGRVQLEAGHLDLHLDKATLWDGALVAELKVDSAAPDVALTASLEKASAAHLFTDHKATGHLDANIDMAGGGRTARALLAAASGRARAVHGQVEFESAPTGPLGRDVLGILFSKKPSGRLRCAVARTTLGDGTGPIAIVIDTPDTTVAGVGALDLHKLDLTVVLRPRSHRTKVGALNTPVLVSGPLGGLRARLATRAMLKGVGETALFAALNPFLLAAPILDLGTGDQNPCDHAVDVATVKALEHKNQLEKTLDSAGRGTSWLKQFLRRD